MWIQDIINNTLKKDDGKGGRRFSRTSLTMFSSWFTAITMAWLNIVRKVLTLMYF